MVFTKKIHQLIPLGFILVLAFFLRLPSLFEPNHYGDEGIYQVLGQQIRRGALLYQDVWDNKPPLLYLLYAFFDGDQFSLRLLSLIFALLSMVSFYFLSQEIFQKRPKVVFSLTLIFSLLFALPLLEGNIANSENFMLFPIILAFYLAWKNLSKITASLTFIAGLLFSLAFLLKIVAVFDLAALFLFLTFTFWEKKKQLIKLLVTLLLGFTFSIGITILFFFSQGVLKEFLSAVLSQNVSYVAWGNEFLIPQGRLLLKLFLLSLFCLFLFLKRKAFSESQLLIFLWFAFSLFNALFAERPWIHYLLVLLPSFCLLLGSFWAEIKFRKLTLIILIFTFYLVATRFWIYGQTLTYYANFFSYGLGQKTTAQYRNFWGSRVSRDYQVAQFLTLKTSAEEPTFIWGNSAQIYALAKRPPVGPYVVAYHANFTPQAREETISALTKSKPRYFIILPEAEPLRDLEVFLAKNYFRFGEGEGFLIYEKRP